MAEDVTMSVNEYIMTAMGDIWARQGDAWKQMNRERLLHEKPFKLNAPVYEQLSYEMVHGAYGRGTPLEKFIAGIRKIAAKAPEGCPVFVKYEQESDYEGGYDYYFEVGYERPPTAEEVAARKARNAEIREVQAEHAAKAEEREREEFERLRAKFASDSDGSA